MRGKINKQKFETMIDSGSPTTIFTKEELCRLLKTDLIFVRKLSANEQNVDYNGRPLTLMGYVTVNVEVGKKLKGAKIIVTRDGHRSLIGRDWLTKLNFCSAESQKKLIIKQL